MNNIFQTATGDSIAPWLTVQDVANHLRVAPGTVRNWASAGFIPCHRFRRVLRFDMAEIEAWVRQRGRAVKD